MPTLRWPAIIPCPENCGEQAEPYTVEVEGGGITQVLVCPRCGMVEDALMEDIPGRGSEDP